MAGDEGLHEAAEDAVAAWDRYRERRGLTGNEMPELDLAVRMRLLAGELGEAPGGPAGPESAEEGLSGNRVTPPDSSEAYRASERAGDLRAWAEAHGGRYIEFPQTERVGALVIETAGPWRLGEAPPLAEIRAVTDWGPWAQHNFPCPVCKERVARVELSGWVFGPCWECATAGWKLELRPRRTRWWERLTRRR